jgi:hypothetical protein
VPHKFGTFLCITSSHPVVLFSYVLVVPIPLPAIFCGCASIVPLQMSALSVIDLVLQDGRLRAPHRHEPMSCVCEPCDHPTNCTRLEETLDFIKDQRQSREAD